MAMTAAGEEGRRRVLSHGDMELIRSDLAILNGPRFVNDRIIAVYFAHLSVGLYSDDLLLLLPSIPYLSNLPDPDSIAAVADLLRLVLLPVNDNPYASVAEGGSHWTLLVLILDSATSPSTPRFVHHDSLRGAPNLPIAEPASSTVTGDTARH
ncbi:NEDD8-specific protease 1-like [Miscanthus floridulus]|uniref:NEDD8-specific protease 1-like n=1 Tax=Miscanthus floridulus TaxID=154761 RepID=UPI0034586541